MKTQLHRMKQRAAQSVGRAEKTDLLTGHLQLVEKTVEKVKTACTTTSKKLNACMLSNGPDLEKRKKKLAQLHLGQGMVECAGELGEKSLLGGIMFKAGEAQQAIAGELATYETELDEHVLAPLHELTEVLIPNIAITKKKLSVAQLDMDSAKARWISAQKISQTASSNTNKVEAVAKANLLQSDYEDQSLLFQQIQDQLATDMLTFVAGERKYAQWIFKMLEAQTRYHQAALDVLKDCLPNVEEQIEDDIFRPTFGCPLDIHLRITKREIATVLEECIPFLLQNAMDMQGLFRLAGSSTKIKKLKASLDIGYADMDDYICDVHAVTGVLKLYLRELPEPLLTFKLYEDWINASKIKDIDDRLLTIKELVDLLPKANKDNLRYLVCFLSQLAENSEENKMSASNIAIVIGPNVLWDPDDGGVNLKTTGNISIILETLIDSCKYIFPEGCDFTRRVHSSDSDSINYRFDYDNSPTEHSNSSNIFGDKPKKSEKKGNSKEDLGSPEITGGNIYSDMFKKLHKDKKDIAGEKKGGTGGGIQGYYNPLSASPDPNHNTNEEAVVTQKDGHEELSPPYSPHKKHSITEANATLDVVRDDKGHQRSVSAGNVSDMDIKRSSSTVVKEKNRRPAPPVPKYPPLAPPRSKPPEPPKHKPPEPPPDKPPHIYVPPGP